MKLKNKIDEISVIMLTEEKDAEEQIIEEIKKLPDINEQGRDGRTVLIHACLYGLSRVAGFLIDVGADLNIKDCEGFTALHAAVYGNHDEIVDLLLHSGASVKVKDGYGNSPLMRASFRNPKMIEKLMKHGCDPSEKNNFNVSPIDAFQAYPEIISLLQFGGSNEFSSNERQN